MRSRTLAIVGLVSGLLLQSAICHAFAPDSKRKTVVTKKTSPSYVAFQRDLRAAARYAERVGKPMYISVTSKSCVPCKKQKATTFRNQTVIQELRSKYVAVELTMESNRKLAKALRVRAVPTHLFVAPNLDVLERREGYQTSKQLLARLKRHAQTRRKSSKSEAKASGETVADKPAKSSGKKSTAKKSG